MKQLKFGLSGLKSETPKLVKYIYRGVGLAAVVWVAITSVYGSDIPEALQNEINKGIIFGTTLLYAVCQFFGYAEPTHDDPPLGV